MVTVAEALEMGTRHHQAGRLADAEGLYRQILQVEPNNAQALHLLGHVAIQVGQIPTAVQLIEAAIRSDGAQPLFHFNLGEAHRLLGDLTRAAESFQAALRMQPTLAPAHVSLGIVRHGQGDLAAAVTSFQEAIRLDSQNANAHAHLGWMLSEQGQLAESEASLRRSLDIQPDNAQARYSLGCVLQAQSRLDDAVDCYRAALATPAIDAPTAARCQSNLGSCLQPRGESDEALECFRQAVALAPANLLMHLNLVQAFHFLPGYSPQAVFEEHLQVARQFAEPLTPANPLFTNDRTLDRRLRVGYVCPYFRDQAISYFSEPILAAHDHGSFEITCYSDVTKPDAFTDRFRSYADHWVSIVGQSDAALAERVASDQIDILVDLTGCLPGHRLLTFARKPAPIQVTYIGYQNTTGMTAMDYRLTDAYADPPGVTDAYYTEKLVRLPRAFFCFQPAPDAPEVDRLPALTNGHITFGSFNKFAKVTPQVLSAWSTLLSRVANSRLIILAEQSGAMQRRVQAALAEAGVPADRVQFEGPRSRDRYLALTQQADIVLDSFPFNGHTTICDALWMGLPVVMLAGESYVSRFGGSALVNLGLNELIAKTPEQYVEIAATLAGDLDRLQDLRATLREQMRVSPLLDAAGFTRNLEAEYRRMWVHWCQQTTN